MKNELYAEEVLQELSKVEDALLESARSRNKLLQQESERYIRAGGKRLRPALLINSAMFGEYDSKKSVALAASIEILHLATLIHDDVIDDSKLRRGVETIHGIHGNKVAIFTGDFLFTKAFLMISKIEGEGNFEYLARVIKNLCEGEVDQFVTRYDKTVSVTRYLKRIKLKTALLFSLACHIGAKSAKCDDKTTKYLRNYGMALGTAFQIEDDILDFTGKKDKLGKPVANDLKVGVYTLPIIYALNTKKYSERLEILLKDTSSRDNVDEIINIVNDSGGLEYSIKMYNRYIEKAKKWIGKLPDNKYRDHLNELTFRMIGRQI